MVTKTSKIKGEKHQKIWSNFGTWTFETPLISSFVPNWLLIRIWDFASTPSPLLGRCPKVYFFYFLKASLNYFFFWRKLTISFLKSQFKCIWFKISFPKIKKPLIIQSNNSNLFDCTCLYVSTGFIPHFGNLVATLPFSLLWIQHISNCL